MKSPSPSPEPSRGHPWGLAALALCVLLPSLGVSIANVALPSLAHELGVSFQQVQWVMLAYLLASTTLIVSVGHLGDLGGRRRLLLAGITLFTAASLCAGTSGFWVLIAARVAQGLGAAIMMALGMALVSQVAPKDRAGRAMGLLGTMSAIGTALGPTLGGVLIGEFGWRAIFLINLPLGGVALVLALRGLPADMERAPTRPAGFDYSGTLLLAATLTAYALAVTLGRGHPGALNMALLLTAACSLAGFILVERRSTSPLIHLAMLREPLLGSGLGMSSLVATVIMATLVVGPFYLTQTLGLSAAQTGLAMSAGPALAALAGVPAGHLVDRFGAQRMSLAGLAAMSAGTLLLSTLPASTGVPGYLGAIALVTPAYALFQTANNTQVMTAVPAGQRGLVSGLLNLSRNLGLITGASVMGAVFSWAAKVSDMTVAHPGAVAAGMRHSFAVATLLLLAATAIALASRAYVARGTSTQADAR